jgi:hypothetical protein
MAKETLASKVETIVTSASKQAEDLIKQAVRDRMSKKPYPQGIHLRYGYVFLDRLQRSVNIYRQ